MKGSMLKGIGIAATVVGMVASFATDWVAEKKMDEKINERVNEALAKRETEGES